MSFCPSAGWLEFEEEGTIGRLAPMPILFTDSNGRTLIF